MDKRYQVFISSTFKDLQEERREVMQTLLEMDCFPAGMELFPASDDDQWTLIKRVIDECDYYLLIVGNRYGSLDETGVSYTEKEYDYAIQKKKPVMAFVHADPSNVPVGKTDMSEAAQALLAKFRDKVQKKMCKYWKSPQDLGGLVAKSFSTLKKTHPAEGWVKAGSLASPEQLEKMERLRERIQELEQELEDVRTKPPPGANDLASGSQEFTLHLSYKLVGGSEQLEPVKVSWNYVFGAIAPYMFDEAFEEQLRSALTAAITRTHQGFQRMLKDDILIHSRPSVVSEDWQTVKVQLKALGLIKKSERKKALKDARTFWTLTPYGESYATTLRAIPKSGEQPAWFRDAPPAVTEREVEETEEVSEE